MEINNDELVSNPSKMTCCLLNIIDRLSIEQSKTFQTRNIINKFIGDVKINLYLKEGYLEFYKYLNDYKIPIFRGRKINLLTDEFLKFYKQVTFHNFALAYYYTRNRQLSNLLFTVEDKKIRYFKKLYNKEIEIAQFNQEFGHYALNAFELSSRRFEEYSSEELLAVAELVVDFRLNEKETIEEYMLSKQKNIMPMLIAIRELAKYKVLFLVRDIRYELLEIARSNNIKDIFNKTFEEIVNLAVSPDNQDNL